LLGPAPLRLSVLGATPGVLALEKPAGVRWEDENGVGVPVAAAVTVPAAAPARPAAAPAAVVAPASSLIAALRRQLDADKPELRQFALERPVSVWPLESDIAGIGLLVSRGTEDHWRNAFGSEQLRFHFVFLARGDNAQDSEFECSLPIARHTSKPVALVSHITGKKSRTLFRRLAGSADSSGNADATNGADGSTNKAANAWAWWEAETDYPRFHQVRLHAAECGLSIAGETRYADAGAPVLEQFLRRGRLNKGQARPLLDGVCLRLARVDCSRAGISGWGLLVAPEPPKWTVLHKRMG
jgi:hypothetical protein